MATATIPAATTTSTIDMVAAASRAIREPRVVVQTTSEVDILDEAVDDVWVGDQVVTVGGGFTSMDCVRTVMRMGADTSIMTYRRTVQEIPVEELELDRSFAGVKHGFGHAGTVANETPRRAASTRSGTVG